MIGRDYYGVFPLRGKLLNVRDANHSTIMANKEISELKQILGLQQVRYPPRLMPEISAEICGGDRRAYNLRRTPCRARTTPTPPRSARCATAT